MECHRLLGVKSSLLLIFKQDGQQPGSAAQEADSAFTLPKRPEPYTGWAPSERAGTFYSCLTSLHMSLMVDTMKLCFIMDGRMDWAREWAEVKEIKCGMCLCSCFLGTTVLINVLVAAWANLQGVVGCFSLNRCSGTIPDITRYVCCLCVCISEVVLDVHECGCGKLRLSCVCLCGNGEGPQSN